MSLSARLLLMFFCVVFVSANEMSNYYGENGAMEVLEFPQPIVQLLYAKGFKISIPEHHVRYGGILSVTYHIKINEIFEGPELGAIIGQVQREQREGVHFTFEYKFGHYPRGTIINYWLDIAYAEFTYRLSDQSYVVEDQYYPRFPNGKIYPRYVGEDTDTCRTSVTRLALDIFKTSSACKGQLLLDEDFSSYKDFRESWQILEEFSKEPDHEFVVYRNSKENVAVRKSNLIITPRVKNEELEMETDTELILPKCTGKKGTLECHRHSHGWNILPPITSGRVNTDKFFNFMYGRIEVRAKLPRGDWIYPLIMLEPVQRKSPKFQLRIASSVGNVELFTTDNSERGLTTTHSIDGKNLFGGVFRKFDSIDEEESHDNLAERSASSVMSELWSDEYHNYEMEWIPNRMIIRVDGETIREFKVSLPGAEKWYYLTLGVAVGGHNEFPDNCTSATYDKPWRNREAKALYNFQKSYKYWSETWEGDDVALRVDRVRIWAV